MCLFTFLTPIMPIIDKSLIRKTSRELPSTQIVQLLPLEIITCRLPPEKLHFNPGNGDRAIYGASIPQKRCSIFGHFWLKETHPSKSKL